ncbi:helix-turn-helix domain-containing protein [Parapedobacter tibetensis]|uniref:helix-turn-helix domain-containing protein n=1 Tax=Parapedobacter tibetensis TaxID=2972951 RepID=UPI00214D2896|nr:helix-turn-helix domain-containing protein [Parapedobacter tibetensis]
MKFSKIAPNDNVSILVKDIMVFEDVTTTSKTVLPFFADGLPGLMFHITPNGQWVQPHNKKMPILYIYGQTINPVELHMNGPYKIITFQLYPFVLSSFFHINPKDINDGCFDLTNLDSWNKVLPKLNNLNDTKHQTEIIQAFLYDELLSKKDKLDFAIREAIQLVFQSNAQLTVLEISKKIHLTVRTFQRHFLAEVGVTPKEFIQIIKFQQSLEQLTEKEYEKLTEIVYNNGFADQSHFIKVFKAFTGKTPKNFLKK